MKLKEENFKNTLIYSKEIVFLVKVIKEFLKKYNKVLAFIPK